MSLNNINEFELTIEKREESGSGSARAARKAGKIPVTVYGKSIQPVSGLINLDILSKAINSRTLFNKFTNLNVGKDKFLVFAKVVQKDPVKDEIKHIDFQAVDKKTKVQMRIPVRFTNKELCEDIKLGGQLNAVVDSLELVGLPSDMPSYIDYDLSKAKVGVSIRVEDLGIDKKVLIRKNSDAVVATILAGKKKGGTEEAATSE